MECMLHTSTDRRGEFSVNQQLTEEEKSDAARTKNALCTAFATDCFTTYEQFVAPWWNCKRLFGEHFRGDTGSYNSVSFRRSSSWPREEAPGWTRSLLNSCWPGPESPVAEPVIAAARPTQRVLSTTDVMDPTIWQGTACRRDKRLAFAATAATKISHKTSTSVSFPGKVWIRHYQSSPTTTTEKHVQNS